MHVGVKPTVRVAILQQEVWSPSAASMGSILPDLHYITRSKNFSESKKDLGMACHIPPLKKSEQGKCHLLKNTEYMD